MKKNMSHKNGTESSSKPLHRYTAKLLHCYTATLAAFPSLFFSPEEMAPLQISHAPLVLSGILYTDPTHWSVWLNGEVIRPETIREDFHIEAVTPTSVTLLRTSSGLAETLHLQGNE